MRLNEAADRQVGRANKAQRPVADDRPSVGGERLRQLSFRLSHSPLEFLQRSVVIGIRDGGGLPPIPAANCRQLRDVAATPDDQSRRRDVFATDAAAVTKGCASGMGASDAVNERTGASVLKVEIGVAAADAVNEGKPIGHLNGDGGDRKRVGGFDYLSRRF